MEKTNKNLSETLLESIKNKKFHIDNSVIDEPIESYKKIRENCPYETCDGSGFIEKKSDNLSPIMSKCDCYHDYSFRKKQNKSNIPPLFFHSDFESIKEIDHLITQTRLKPKTHQEERKIDKRKKTIPPETPNSYIDRTYKTIKGNFPLSEFAQKFSQTLLEEFEKDNPKSYNLLLFGDPGKGKTHLSTAIANDFLKNNKSVYFSRLRNLIDSSFGDKEEVQKMLKSADLLILDELGQEYHTDTMWALKLIQDFFKARQEVGLPTIVTTNFYPNEWEEQYGKSLMSIFNGNFLLVALNGDIDLRTHFDQDEYDDLF